MSLTLRTLLCIAAVVLAGVPFHVLAQTSPPPPAKVVVVVQTPAPAAKPVAVAPKLSLSAPSTANLDDNLPIQAVLVDSDGKAISGSAIEFSTAAQFLNTGGSVVFAHALTDKQGTASAEWQPRSGGTVTLAASFAGDARFAAAKANVKVNVTGDRQLYQQHAGISVPGLNAAPPGPVMVALAPVTSPLPRMSGWPLVVVLLIVWSLYARAVLLLFTIARGHRQASPPEAAR